MCCARADSQRSHGGSGVGVNVRKVLKKNALLAMVTLGITLTMGSACEQRAANDYASPESAVVAMFNAFARVSVAPDGAWAFLGPDTRARLEALAADGPADLVPMDYVRFGWLAGDASVRDVKRVRESGRSVTLQVTTEFEKTFEIEMFRTEDGWQTELGVVRVPTPSNDVLPADVVVDDVPVVVDEAP